MHCDEVAKMDAHTAAVAFIAAFMTTDEEGRDKLARWWNADQRRNK